MFRKEQYICALAWVWMTGFGLQAGEPDNPPADQSQATAPPEWSVGPINFSGLVDAYYNFNFNHPADRTNQLRNFDIKANQFSLNMAKLTMEHAADPVGFRVDFGFGRAFDVIHSTERDPAAFRYIEQAYLSLKPSNGRGFQVDLGKFVTSAGAEVIETQNNWNYSRSLLFALAIPYYHFGLRTSMPLGKHFSAGVQLVNGWNNVEDNNSGKTLGVTGVFTTTKATWSHNYYVGVEKNDTNKGLRHVYDTTLLVTPTVKSSFYINFDYGMDKNPGFGSNRWVGIAGAARYQLTQRFALSPRLEWFNDANGFSTGTAQKLKEFTMTGEMKFNEGLLTRLEYRRDWSNRPFFNRGPEPGVYGNQDTLLVGFVAFFGPKR